MGLNWRAVGWLPEQGPDSLPNDSYGFEQADDEEDHDDNRTVSPKMPSSGRDFYFIFYEADQDSSPWLKVIYGKMLQMETDETVAVLSAELVVRDKRGGMFLTCDISSDELLRYARMTCNDDGSLRPTLSNAIGNPARINAAGKGGFLYLDEVHVKRSFRGQDLSLEFMRGLFRYLGSRWSLAVSTIVPYDFCDSRTANGHDYEPPMRTDEERTRLCRHFARIGFEQLTARGWFLERSQLKALSKEDVAQLEVMTPLAEYEPPRLSDLDTKLQEVAIDASVVRYGGGEEEHTQNMAQLESLLKQGANINTALGLHFAAGASADGGTRWRSVALERLLREPTCEIGHMDDRGCTALHVAASVLSEKACRSLLDHGADPLHRNISDGDTENATATALEVNQDNVAIKLRDREDYFHCHGGAYDRNRQRQTVAASMAECRSGYRACTELLEKADAARRAQLGLAEVLIKALMYSRTLSSHALCLQQIHKAITPPHTREYAPASSV